jgi:pantoate--beta-alanine ligase
VVSKLFNIVQPDVSVFGQKDIQQAVCIEKIVADLNFPVRIIISSTVRESDGLAMSSRNKRLSADERARAVAIFKSLNLAEKLIASGERRSDAITAEMKRVIETSGPDKIDYISIVHCSDLDFIDIIDTKSVIAVAAFYGTTRLIDNMIIGIDGGEPRCIY